MFPCVTARGKRWSCASSLRIRRPSPKAAAAKSSTANRAEDRVDVGTVSGERRNQQRIRRWPGTRRGGIGPVVEQPFEARHPLRTRRRFLKQGMKRPVAAVTGVQAGPMGDQQRKCVDPGPGPGHHDGADGLQIAGTQAIDHSLQNQRVMITFCSV